MTPPYSADTRAKGWRFEIDTEAVKASDTWLRARTGAVKGALLLLWSEAWQQTPCGSLPDDDELISLLIDMPAPTFAKNRAVLMRGWARADDGRLYHETITKRVLAMLAKRAKDAKRTADRRERNADEHGVTTLSHVTDDGQTCDPPVSSTPSTKHQAPQEKKKAPAAPSLTVEELQAEGLDAETAAEFIALRNRKRAKLTRRCWDALKPEFDRAGWPAQRAVTKCLARGWTGFEADWVMDAKQKAADLARQTVPAAESEEARQRRIAAERMTPEQREAANKAAKLALSAIKNITPRLAA